MRDPMRSDSGHERAALVRITDALTERDCRPTGRGDHLDARCPAHDDTRPSLSVDWSAHVGGGGAGVKVCCQAGCHTADVAAALGLTLADLYDVPKQRSYRGPRPARAPRRSTSTPRPPRKERPEDDHKHAYRQTATYTYTDVDGTITGEVIRRTCQVCGGKSFAQRRPAEGGGWEYRAPRERPLYRLPEVLAAMREERPILVVEGEKDADAAAAAGFTATCNPGGAGKWRTEHTDTLRGAHVVIVADRDDPGREHARTVYAALAEMNCRLDLVEPIEGKDLYDHLAAGHAVGALAPLPLNPVPERAPRSAEGDADAEVIPLPRRGAPDDDQDDGGRGGGGGGGRRRSRAGLIPIPGMRNGWMHNPLERTIWHTPGKDAPLALIGTAPEVLGRVTYRAADGRHTKLAYQLASETGPRIVQEQDIDTGAWAGMLGRPAPSGRDEAAAYARLIRDQGAAAREVPAVTSVAPDGGMVMPEADAQELGYRQVRGTEADGRAAWRRICSLAVVTERTTLALGATFGGPVVSRLMAVPPHVLNHVGPAQRGKSTTQKAQAALFGNPGEDYDLMASWNTTPNGLPDLLIEARTLPMVREEFSTSGLSVTDGERLLSRIVGGCARSRSRRTGGRAPNAGRWHSLLSSSSNLTLRRPGQTEDLAARLFELSAPFWGDDDDAAARAVEAQMLAEAHHGWPFELAVRAGMFTAESVKRLQQQHHEITARLSPARGGLELTIARVYAAWTLGAYMLGEVLDLPGVGKRAEEDAMTELPNAVAEAHAAHVGPGQLLWEAVSTAAFRDPSSFPPAAALVQAMDMQEGRAILGYQTDGRLYVAPGTLKAICTEAGITSPQPGLKQLRDMGVLIPGDGRHWTRKPDTATLRAAAPVPRFYVFERPAADAAFGGPDDDAPPPPDDGPRDQPPPAEQPTTPGPAADAPPQPPLPAPTEDSAPATSTAASPPQTTPEAPRAAAVAPRTPPPTPTPPAAPAASPTAVQRPPVDPRAYAAGAVVVDGHGGWLSGTAEHRPLPERLETLADLLAWAAPMGLGMALDRGRRDDGQVWLMPDAAARVGLPANPPAEGSKTAREHRALAPLRDAGWTVKDCRAWMTIWRPGARTLRVSVVGWQDAYGCPLLTGDPDGPTLAYRIGRYAEQVGTLYRVSPQVTGVDLNAAIPRKITLPAEAPTPPRPALVRTLEEPFIWSRRPTEREQTAPHVVAVDARAMHLGAAAQVDVGIGAARHLDGPCEFDPKTPGLWRIERPAWQERDLPNLLEPVAHGSGRGGGTRWYATPTLRALSELDYAVRPLEAYVWEERTRYLLPWSNRLRDARAVLLAEAEAGDPDAAALLETLKATYTRTLGYHAHKGSGSYYHPEWWHLIVSSARTNLFRKIHRAYQTEGRAPLAVSTDWVLYAADTTDPAAAVPAALKLGDGLGQFKHIGAAPMEQVAPLLVDRPSAKQVRAVVEAVEGPEGEGE